MKVIEKRKDGSTRVYTKNEQPTMTDQQWKDECDVNFIMAKYLKTGHLPHLQQNPGLYADLSQITDLVGAYEDVKQAEEAFSSLPAALRNEFDNDPIKLVEFMKDPAKKQEAIDKLLVPDPSKKPEAPPEGGAPETEAKPQ